MSNNLIIHYCGGCGINIARSLNENLANLGMGFCNIIPKYLDTSDNNLGSIDPTELWRVEATGFSSIAISGSGGERRTNATAIMRSVKEYLDTNKYGKLVTGEFHIVVFSASGGSGSVISPLLISNLRERGIPVLGIMIGDSSNGLNCKNTLNTIATLDHMAKNTIKKPIVMMYYNNHLIEDQLGVGGKETTVNNMVFNAISVMSLFLSGSNDGLDTTDLLNFLVPDNYKTITIDPSLYCVSIHTNDTVTNDDKTINIIGRTLTTTDQDSDIGITLLHHKYGKVVLPNASKIAKKITPVHIVLVANHLLEEHQRLTATVEEYKNISDSISTATLRGIGNIDESGMVF